MLTEGRKGLGFGVGTEPLSAYFAERGCEIVATDMNADAAEAAGWTNSNEHAAGLAALNQRHICHPERFASHVTFRNADMNAIPSDLSGFDFTWSSCAFEHLGSIDLGLDFVKESARRLRPGGVAVHTTEPNCSSDEATVETGQTVLFRRRDILKLAEDLRAEGCLLDLSFDLGNEPLDRHVDLPPYSHHTHVKLELLSHVTTSFGLFIVKAPRG
jgi:SAM-dependent methyltransferase